MFFDLEHYLNKVTSFIWDIEEYYSSWHIPIQY